MELLNIIKTSGCAVDCGTRAGSVAGRVGGGSGVSGGRLASSWRAVSGGQRRVRWACRVALAHGVRGAARVALAPCPRGSSRTSRTLWRNARGVALAHRARSRDLRCGGHGSGGSWWSQNQGAAHGCLSSKSGLFHVEHRPRFTVGGLDGPTRLHWLQGGVAAHTHSSAASGRSRSQGAPVARPSGRLRAGRWRGGGGARAGRGRGAGAFGALVAVVAHYEKCSEWRQTRSAALALFGKPPLHFS